MAEVINTVDGQGSRATPEPPSCRFVTYWTTAKRLFIGEFLMSWNWNNRPQCAASCTGASHNWDWLSCLADTTVFVNTSSLIACDIIHVSSTCRRPDRHRQGKELRARLCPNRSHSPHPTVQRRRGTDLPYHLYVLHWTSKCTDTIRNTMRRCGWRRIRDRGASWAAARLYGCIRADDRPMLAYRPLPTEWVIRAETDTTVNTP